MGGQPFRPVLAKGANKEREMAGHVVEAALKREIGAGVLVAGAVDELLVAVEHVNVVRHIIPGWFWAAINHEIALALILVGLVLLWKQERVQSRKQEEHPIHPAEQQQTATENASVKDSGNAIVKDVGNPRINIYTHPPTLTPRLPKLRPPEPKANISFKNVRAAWIGYSEHDRRFVENDSKGASVRGVIVRFKNESAAQAASNAQYIRAELIMRDINEQELEKSVHAACWLDEPADTVDFAVGEDHWVVLGAVDRDNAKQWVVPWMQPKTTWEGQFYELKGHTIVGMRSIEIRIIGDSSKWVTKPVVVDITVNNGEPTVAARSPV